MIVTIAVVLIILWLLGFVNGYTMGSFIHIFYVAAIALLVVGLSQEAMINRKLRHVSRSLGPKQDSKRRHERLTDQPITSRIMPRYTGWLRFSLPHTLIPDRKIRSRIANRPK
jgi:hypothetical protein